MIHCNCRSWCRRNSKLQNWGYEATPTTAATSAASTVNSAVHQTVTQTLQLNSLTVIITSTHHSYVKHQKFHSTHTAHQNLLTKLI